MRVKFISLNICLGGQPLESILEFIRKEQPDIMFVQEAYQSKDSTLEKRFRSVDVIKNEGKFPHYFFSPACIDVRKEGKVENGNAIFSLFPITETRTVFFDVPLRERAVFEGSGDFSLTPRNLQCAIINTPDARLNVINVHGIWGFDGKDNERRLKMGKTISEQAKDKENVILAGDFNMQPRTETIAGIERDLKNVFKDELVTTFNMKRKDNPGFATAVVDMIFASRDLSIIDHYCPDVDISDHFPLVAIFEI